jgi:hypothetical protein
VTYYVANLCRYVLVEAATPEEARTLGEPHLGTPARTIRPATPAEIGLQAWHDAHLRAEESQQVPKP